MTVAVGCRVVECGCGSGRGLYSGNHADVILSHYSIEQRFHRSFVKLGQPPHRVQLHVGFAIGFQRMQPGHGHLGMHRDFPQRQPRRQPQPSQLGRVAIPFGLLDFAYRFQCERKFTTANNVMSTRIFFLCSYMWICDYLTRNEPRYIPSPWIHSCD